MHTLLDSTTNSTKYSRTMIVFAMKRIFLFLGLSSLSFRYQNWQLRVKFAQINTIINYNALHMYMANRKTNIKDAFVFNIFLFSWERYKSLWSLSYYYQQKCHLSTGNNVRVGIALWVLHCCIVPLYLFHPRNDFILYKIWLDRRVAHMRVWPLLLCLHVNGPTEQTVTPISVFLWNKQWFL